MSTTPTRASRCRRAADRRRAPPPSKANCGSEDEAHLVVAATCNCGSEDEAHLVFAATCVVGIVVGIAPQRASVGRVVPRERLCPVTLLVRRKSAHAARSLSPAQPLLSLSECSPPVPAARPYYMRGTRYKNIKFSVLACRGGRAGAIARKGRTVRALRCYISDQFHREKSGQKRPTDGFQGQGWPLVRGCCLCFRVFLL